MIKGYPFQEMVLFDKTVTYIYAKNTKQKDTKADELYKGSLQKLAPIL